MNADACAGECVKRIVVIAVVTLGLFYIGDYLWVWYRAHHPSAGEALGSVDVYYETPLKNGKSEIFFGQAEKQTCVRSVFPQMGYTPCWIASRRNLRSVRQKVLPTRDIGLPKVVNQRPFQLVLSA
jgi:hypothetical protein